MTVKRTVLVCCFALILVTGCAGSRNLFVLLPDPDGQVGEITVSSEKGTQVLSKPYQATEVTRVDQVPKAPYVMEEKDVTNTFGAALAAQPAPPVSFLLYFKTGTTELTDESLAMIPDIVAAVKNRSVPDISVIGHSDRVGSDEVNRRLSLDRANAVAALLVEKGVDRGMLEITYHGEENPLVPTADNVPEPRNRRVEVNIR